MLPSAVETPTTPVTQTAQATQAQETDGSAQPHLARRLLAEFLGTCLLLTAIVGSGIMAVRLSPGDVGLQLIENVAAIVCTLGALIVFLRPVSGAHFNPLVSIVDWYLGRGTSGGLRGRDIGPYAVAQFAGSIAGAVLANLMFELPAVQWSQHGRLGWHLLLGEVVATAGLILLVFALGRSGHDASAPMAVSAYFAGAAWFTSSTAFANPAVTMARSFSDTFTGISPASVPGFVLGQVLGALVGTVLVVVLFPKPAGSGPAACASAQPAASAPGPAPAVAGNFPATE